MAKAKKRAYKHTVGRVFCIKVKSHSVPARNQCAKRLKNGKFRFIKQGTEGCKCGTR